MEELPGASCSAQARNKTIEALEELPASPSEQEGLHLPRVPEQVAEQGWLLSLLVCFQHPAILPSPPLQQEAAVLVDWLRQLAASPVLVQDSSAALRSLPAHLSLRPESGLGLPSGGTVSRAPQFVTARNHNRSPTWAVRTYNLPRTPVALEDLCGT